MFVNVSFNLLSLSWKFSISALPQNGCHPAKCQLIPYTPYTPIANLYLAGFEGRFYKLLLQYVEDLKVDWSRINFIVWYVKNKHRVECLFTGFLSPIEIRRTQIYFDACTCVFNLDFGIILLKPTAVSIRK